MALRSSANRVREVLGSSVPGMLRGFASAKLPDLPYDFGALEPYISGQIMELHHSKHHNAYVANYNKALEQYAEAEKKGDIAKMIAMQGAIKFNGGGTLQLVLVAPGYGLTC